MGDAPDYDRSHWLNEKFKLGLDFPNLPYLMMGLTGHPEQRHRSLHARKHNMCGETEEEKIRVDVFENQVWMCASNGQAVLSPDFEKLKSDFLEEIPGIMKLFSEFLGRGLGCRRQGKGVGFEGQGVVIFSRFRVWYPFSFAFLQLTFVDFLAYDVLDVYRIFEPKCLDEFPNLKDFMSCLR
ncbi:Glutathione S-transferase Mu 4 [Camelus dromedarius]|uniref:glutathione transferase n=1 Tax=Camelus dromedarius TaxID=9838 RepID=A0A5N4DUK5_CAMDR|nr:Glutathione S-transferase Mu 4 [Camelus dromedarius]KAB1274747.1 Glutathione S-transferase Mu 4 [Camelus dromedarius]